MYVMPMQELMQVVMKDGWMEMKIVVVGKKTRAALHFEKLLTK